MIPVLFQIGSIKVYSFGLMMGIAFIVANYFFAREMRRRGVAEQVAGAVTLIALVGGVAGSKLFSLLEEWDQFIADPVGQIFSAAGLTFYGGLIVATLAIALYLRAKKVRFLYAADSAAPSLILAYGIGRIGCQLAGDGDYGIPTDLPWAMRYPHGTVSTVVDPGLAAKLGVAPNQELGALFHSMYPDRAIPADIAVHPAPVYETLASVAIFLLLWKMRQRPRAAGALFAIYLICAGIERLLVEFIRLNPLYAGLSEAQWISIGLMAMGTVMLLILRNRPAETFTPATPKPRGKR